MRRLLIVTLYALIGVMQAPGTLMATDFRLDFYADIRGLANEGNFIEAERLVEDAFLTASSAPPPDRMALLDTLADLQIASGKLSDAGDTYWNKAAILARFSGADSPDLATVYTAAGRVYLQADNALRAIDAFEAALRIDRRFLHCDSKALAALYLYLADAHEAAGQSNTAKRARRLAEDPEARCADSDPTRGVATAAPKGEGEFALIEVLFATDRKETGADKPDERFGVERGSVSYGRVAVTIPRDHKPGQIEAPSLLRFTWEENPALHIVLMSVDALQKDQFFSEIGNSLDVRSSDEVFLFIHGFNVTFAKAAKRTAQMVYDLNFEGAPVFYSWPSRGHPGAYMADAATVQVSARHLSRFLEDLVARSGAKRIQIVAHSMGNRALTEALEIYALRHPAATAVFDQIIFAAPDVDSELFALQVKTFERLAQRMTLYTSNADLALSTSQKLHGNAPRAGLALDEPLVTEAVDTIDMSVIGDSLLNHSYFAADSSALSDMLWLFWRNPPPPSRCGMAEEAGDNGVHWIYVAEECESNVLLSAISLARRGGDGAVASLDARIAKLQTEPAPAPAAELLPELERVRQVLIELLAR